MKMQGDYLRYLAEFDEAGGQRPEQANQAYSAALQVACQELSAAHPIRLGLALNYSVFYNEVMRDALQATNLARKASDEAKENWSSLDQDEERDSAQIMGLLQDNLKLWTEAGADGAAQLDGTAVEDL